MTILQTMGYGCAQIRAMSNFLHKFFSDPLVGLLAVGAIILVTWLAWADFKERRNRRAFEERRRQLQDY